jgi:hypothetical protein
MRDLKAELEQDSGHLPSWKPEIGDTLVGRIVDSEIVLTKWGEAETAIIEDDTGTRTRLYVTPAVLKTLWTNEQPGIGDQIGVKRVAPPEGKTWKNFILKVDRAVDPEPDASSDPFTGSGTPYAQRTMANGAWPA